MAQGPCQNPNCKSFGRPHPNCRCYGEMAEGGETGFCSSSRMHDKECEYYAEGGHVEDESLPPGFVLDKPSAAPSNETAPVVEKPVMKEDEGLPPGFVIDKPAGAPVADEPLPPGFVLDKNKYESPAQQLGTVAEGFAQGIPGIGPAITAGEIGLSKLGVPNLSAEDINQRAEANPKEHLGAKTAGFVVGMSPVAKGIAAAGLGSAALQSALAGIAAGSSDEATNWITGKTDPYHPIASSLANIGASGLFNLAGSAAGKKIGSGISNMIPEDLSTKLPAFLEGVASSAKGISINPLIEQANLATKQAGARFYNALSSNLIPHAAGAVEGFQGAKEGYNKEGLYGAGKGLISGAILGELEGLVGKKVINKISETVGKNAVAPLITKVLSNGSAEGLGDAIDHFANAAKGSSKIQLGIENLFSGLGKTSQQAYSDIQTNDNAEKRKELKNFIENGGYDQNINETIKDPNSQEPGKYAEGGAVKKNLASVFDHHPGLAQHFPEQHVLLTAAKARISNYLRSQKPADGLENSFFDERTPNDQEIKNYNQALNIANHPLGVLDHVKHGTLDTNHVKHLNNMYPEISQVMKEKVVEQVLKSKMENKKPPYSIRQSLSLLTGMPLSKELSPTFIQAAQNTFNKGNSSQQQPAPKKGKSSLAKIADQFLTNEQARIANDQRT